MKKGYTLIELIAAIIILGIIGLIVFPVISNTIRTNKENLYNSMVKDIKRASNDWIYKNMDLLPTSGGSVTITILDLKKSGLLDINLRNPKTDELIPNDVQITITLQNNKYVFNVDMNSGTSLSSPYDINAPMLILNGNAIEYIEYGSTYEELSAIARGKAGNIITNINIVYQYNGTQIPGIDTRQFKTYTVVYSASDNYNGHNYTTNITRTVIVRDTTAPELIVPEQATITLNQVSNFDLISGVSVSDNSGEVIEVTATSLENKVGRQVISYTACDSHANCVTKKRIINVTE